MINGVSVEAGSSWSLADWKSVIDPILATTEQRFANVNDCPAGQQKCEYSPHKSVCCTTGERCIPNVGCRCFNLRTGNVCA